MTAHRMTGFLFGLDQITLMLAMYLCVGRPAGVWSVDRWIRSRFVETVRDWNWLAAITGLPLENARENIRENNRYECSSNTVAIRLIQIHLCVIYLFGGIGKMRGETWWDGSAMWYSIASYEYQSFDMTWIGRYPFLSSIATHLTVFWELSYCALVWPRRTRPFVLAIAILVHGGIALFLGMITFGAMMIVANIAFVPSGLFLRLHSLGQKQ